MRVLILVVTILSSFNSLEASPILRGFKKCFAVLTGRTSTSPEELRQHLAPIFQRLKKENLHAEDRMRTYSRLREVAEKDADVAAMASVMMVENFYDFVGRPDFFNQMMFSWYRWSTPEGRDALLASAPKALRTYRSLAHAQVLFNLSVKHGFTDAVKEYFLSLSPTLLSRVVLDQAQQLTTQESIEYSRRLEIPLRTLSSQRQHFHTFAKLARQESEHFGTCPLLTRLQLLLTTYTVKKSPDVLVEIVNLIEYLKLNPKYFKKAEYVEIIQDLSPELLEFVQTYFPILTPALSIETVNEEGLNAFAYPISIRSLL